MKNKNDSATLKDLAIAVLAGFAGVIASQLVKNALSPTRVTVEETTRSFVESLIEEGIDGVNGVTKRIIG